MAATSRASLESSSFLSAPALFIREKFEEFVATDPRNALLPAQGGGRIYGAPLVGIASADDPYFKEFSKPEIIGPVFMPPGEWLPGARSIISYFLPFSWEIRGSNRKEWLPSLEWVGGRIEGEAFNGASRSFLAELLRGFGVKALAPGLDKRFRIDSSKVVSNWSERHAAFVAGLGTFGLHKGLITEKGTAGRFGSVLTDLDIEPTRRAYSGVNDYCPFLTGGKCGACITRCQIGSITKAGKDKMICSEYIDGEMIPMFSTPEQLRYGCGKCNAGVPCEAGIPRIS